MKKQKLIMLTLSAALAIVLVAADHIDAPKVTGEKTDVTDIYAFQSPENPSNMVLAANVQGLMDPTTTAEATFDDDLLIEFNIDNDGDNIEDILIQCTFDDGEMRLSGPRPAINPGTSSTISDEVSFLTVDVTPYGSAPIINERLGFKAFAGPRDDPFFFDFFQYNDILAGEASGFNEVGNDSFAGTNVLSVVIELSKSFLQAEDSVNVWVETKREQ